MLGGIEFVILQYYTTGKRVVRITMIIQLFSKFAAKKERVLHPVPDILGETLLY